MGAKGSYQDVLNVLQQANKPMSISDIESALGITNQLACNIMWRMCKHGNVPGLTRSGRSGEGKSGNGYKYYIFKEGDTVEEAAPRYSTWCRENIKDSWQTNAQQLRY